MENVVNGFDFGALPIKSCFVGRVEDTEWPHFLWNVTISFSGGNWSFPYRCGLGHVEKKPGAIPMPNPPYQRGTIAYAQWEKHNMRPKKPSNSDIMHCILGDAVAADMSFNDWCDEFGYNNDSMRAFRTYQTCCESALFIRKAFSRDQVEQMKQALEDY